jgi:hypothetical protein
MLSLGLVYVTATSVERFLARPGIAVPLSDDGFLRAEFVEGTLEPWARSFGIRKWSDLDHESCVVLLGEPGSGKTRVFEEARARLAAPINTRRVDLGMFGSGEHLEKGLAFTEWLSAVGTADLHVFLDGLDECLAQIDKAPRILLKRLEAVPSQDRSRLKLRIACRTGAWSSALASELPKLFPGIANANTVDEHAHLSSSKDRAAASDADSRLPIWELLPLRRSDAAILASDRARQKGKILDPTAFLAAVETASVGPLAARPKTLFYLVDLFLLHQALPGERWELYRRALLHGCSEEVPFRAEELPREAWSPEERLLLMARIAAGLLLGNCIALRRTESSTTVNEELRVEDIAEGGTIPIGTRQATPAEVRRVLRKEPHPLQASEGDLIRFAHRTEVEFLAAFHLVSQEPDAEQLWAVLCAGGNSIRPQLAELASWVASQVIPLRERIIQTNPEILLRGGLSTLTDPERADLTERVLQACASHKLADGVGGWDEALDRLAHRNLPQQLLPWLTSDQDFVARRVAMCVAEECHPNRGQWSTRPQFSTVRPPSTGDGPTHSSKENASWLPVIERLIEIVLDAKEDLLLRKQAIRTLSTVADASRWQRLRPFIHFTSEDQEGDIRGIALRSLLRRGIISLEEVFTAVRSPPGVGYFGAYWNFVYHEIPRWLQPSSLPAALKWFREVWIKSRARLHEDSESIEGAILQAAWKHADDESIQRELVATLLDLFRNNLDAALNRSILDEFPAYRRAISERLIREAADQKGEVLLIGHSLRASAELIRPDDLHWLLAWHRSEPHTTVRRGICNAVKALLPLTQLDHIDALLIACDQDSELKSTFSNDIEAWNLDDADVMKIRERARRTAKRQSARIDPELEIQASLAASTTEPNYFESLLFALARSLKGEDRDIDAYWTPLNELPGWQGADAARREAIREAAIRFLSVGPPTVESWFGKKSCPSYVLTGTRALLLFADHLKRLEAIPAQALEGWTVAMLTHGLDAAPQDWLAPILSALASRFPKTISDTVDRLVKLPDTPHASERALRDSRLYWCEPLASIIRAWLVEGSLAPEQDDAALSALSHVEPSEAARISWARLEVALPPISFARLPYVVNAATALLQLLSSESFTRWWELISRDEALTRKAMGRIASHRRRDGIKFIPTEKLATQDIETWFRWLVRAYPPRRKAAPTTRMLRPVTPFDDVTVLRESLTQLLANRATDEDVAALERLDQDFPTLSLRWLVARAYEVRRSHGWTGWRLKDLWSLLHPPSASSNVAPSSFNAARMHECMRSDAIKGVYLLGCFDRRVTLYAQQCRALNLVRALAEREDLRTGATVAVIGGGVGGLTAAAAARLVGASVTLYEEEKDLLPLQREAHHRWIHPRIYEALEWPQSDTSDLPVLSWKAGVAPEVVSQIEREFRRFVSSVGDIQIRSGKRVSKIAQGAAKKVLLLDDNDIQTQYDLAIVAIGFGKESSSAQLAAPPLSYWTPDKLMGDLGSKRILVSGSGDGALIDIARALLKDFRHAEFTENLLKNALYQPLREQFLKIETDLKNKDNVSLWTAYSTVEISQDVFASLPIRADANVTFNSSHYGYFDRGTSPHNRLLALLLLNAKRAGKPIVDRWPGRIIQVEPVGTLQRVTVEPCAKAHESAEEVISTHSSTEREFDIVVLRHGPTPRYFENNIPNLKADVERQRKVLASLDFTREMDPSTRDYFRRLSHTGTTASR